MSNKKGFTLIEIIVVLIILGILAAIAVPLYSNYIQGGASTAAQNNLVTIYGAEKSFYLSNAYYCSTSTQNPTCADTLTDLNTGLSLNISDNNFNYACSDPSGTGTAFSCTATNISDPTFILTVTGGVNTYNTSIILPGSPSCTATPTGSTGCNPSCANPSGSYCPT